MAVGPLDRSPAVHRWSGQRRHGSTDDDRAGRGDERTAVRAPRLRGRRRWTARRAGRPAPRRRRDRSDGRRAGGAPRRPAGVPARRAPCRTARHVVLLVVDGLAAWRQVVAERLGGERGRSARPGAGRRTGRRHRGGGDGRTSGRAAAGHLGRGERPAGLPAGRSGRPRSCSGCDRPRWPTCRAVARSSPAAASTCRWRRSSTCPQQSRASPPVGPPTPARGRHRPSTGCRSGWPSSTFRGRVVAASPTVARHRRSGRCRSASTGGPSTCAAWSCTRVSTCWWPGPLDPVARPRSVLLARQVRAADPAARVITLDPTPLAPAGALLARARRRPGRAGRDALGTPAPSGRAKSHAPCSSSTTPSWSTTRARSCSELVSGCSALTVVAAGRVDALRSAYGHWTQVLRRQRRGLLLRPTSDLDGDVLGVTLPRREAVPAAPGRGYLVADGGCALVQLAWPDRAGNGWAD